MIITRFAPSPTGDPHIGNIRTALFAYLFAKKNDGKFLLRIEDTDQKRYDEKSIAVIQEALSWLKMLPDNLDEPMIQSKRLDIYKEAALKLVSEGKAYVCDCSKERLDEIRQKQVESGRPPGYDGHCRDLNLEFKDDRVIRMKIPQGQKIVIDDIVRGHVEFDTSAVDDQVIIKSDGFPTYHLAHVVDDHAMQVTHVIRSEEWLPSTPKHIILNKMLGYTVPSYAHAPVILSPTKGKLSKRDGAVGVLEYRNKGYLWQAMINFMVLLGWNPKDDEEIFDQDINIYEQLVPKFDLDQVNKAPAIFDLDKLNFFNRHFLQKVPVENYIDVMDEDVLNRLPENKRIRIVEIAKDRMTTLSDFEATISYFLTRPEIDASKIVFKKSNPETTKQALLKTVEKLSCLSDWSAKSIKSALEQVVSENSFSNGDVFWSTRYGLSGEEKSPPPEDIADVLGQEETIDRLNKTISLLS